MYFAHLEAKLPHLFKVGTMQGINHRSKSVTYRPLSTVIQDTIGAWFTEEEYLAVSSGHQWDCETYTSQLCRYLVVVFQSRITYGPTHMHTCNSQTRITSSWRRRTSCVSWKRLLHTVHSKKEKACS